MKIRRLVILLLLVCFVFSGTGIQVYAVELGEKLEQPENGWARYDVVPSENVVFSDTITFWDNYTAYPVWNKTLARVHPNRDVTAKFKFKGTKIRVIAFPGPDRSDDASIAIDGVTELIPHQRTTDYQSMGLIYEKTGLEDKVHDVVITPGTNGSLGLFLDAIDIDEDGELIHPYTPTNLTATAGDIKVDLSWDPVTDADGYSVKRSLTTGGPYTTIAQEVYGTTYTDTDVINGTTYYYVVSAVLNGVESENSNEALAAPSSSPSSVLDIEPEKEKISLNEEIIADLVIDNITEIAAEDIKIDYDEEKLEFLGFEEVEGMKLVKSIEDTGNGELRVITASKGEANIVNAKEILLKLKFKGIQSGEALVDITKGRVTDGIELEKDLTAEECGEATITIEAVTDVNNSGEFTLLDLGIDARHLTKDPASPELAEYNTDIVVNGQIDEDDLLEIGRLILENPNYAPNN